HFAFPFVLGSVVTCCLVRFIRAFRVTQAVHAVKPPAEDTPAAVRAAFAMHAGHMARYLARASFSAARRVFSSMCAHPFGIPSRCWSVNGPIPLCRKVILVPPLSGASRY